MTRTVQGVDLRMPWSHRLPDYAAAVPAYGQNVVRLAERLATGDGPVPVVDVGANIGDTALQVLHRVDARVLCVEGDPHWLTWLRLNTETSPAVTIAPGLLTTGEPTSALVPERHSGTTRFVEGSADLSAGTLAVSELWERYPDFHGARLVKSDTDGYDVVLAPALAATYAASRPVLFLEYDLGLSRDAGNDPAALWPALAELGYETVSVWDNFGAPVCSTTVAALAAQPDIGVTTGDGAPYWDVAVAHRDDRVGTAAVLAGL